MSARYELEESRRFDPAPSAIEQPRLLSVVISVAGAGDALDALVPAVRRALCETRTINVEFVFVDDLGTVGTADRAAALGVAWARCSGDVIVSMHAGLKDSLWQLPLMIDAWRAGYAVVMARRSSYPRGTVLRCFTTDLARRIHNVFSDRRVEANVVDYSLMDRSVVDALRRLPLSQRHIQGLPAWVGFRSMVIGPMHPLWAVYG